MSPDCPSCGKPWAKHQGVQVICNQLRLSRKLVTSQRGSIKKLKERVGLLELMLEIHRPKRRAV